MTRTGEQGWAELLAVVSDPATGVDVGAMLDVVVALGGRLVPASIGCSLTERDGAGYRTPVWSNDLALELDMAQYRAGVGPCVNAARDSQSQRWDDRNSPFHVADFAAAAGRFGARSVLSVPVRGAPAVALNLYGGTPDAFAQPRSAAVAGLLARCVGRLMPDLRTSRRRADDGAGMDDALERRSLLLRARARLAEDRDVSEDEAFTVLAEQSAARRCSIVDVCHDVLGETP